MHDFVTALALLLVLEGAAYALFPDGMKRAIAIVLTQPSSALRTAGVALAAVGVLMVWLIRG